MIDPFFGIFLLAAPGLLTGMVVTLAYFVCNSEPVRSVVVALDTSDSGFTCAGEGFGRLAKHDPLRDPQCYPRHESFRVAFHVHGLIDHQSTFRTVYVVETRRVDEDFQLAKVVAHSSIFVDNSLLMW